MEPVYVEGAEQRREAREFVKRESAIRFPIVSESNAAEVAAWEERRYVEVLRSMRTREVRPVPLERA